LTFVLRSGKSQIPITADVPALREGDKLSDVKGTFEPLQQMLFSHDWNLRICNDGIVR
jgi:hypothetical protein